MSDSAIRAIKETDTPALLPIRYFLGVNKNTWIMASFDHLGSIVGERKGSSLRLEPLLSGWLVRTLTNNLRTLFLSIDIWFKTSFGMIDKQSNVSLDLISYDDCFQSSYEKGNVRWVLPPPNLSQPIAGKGAVTIACLLRCFPAHLFQWPIELYYHWMSLMWGYRRHTPSANDIACFLHRFIFPGLFAPERSSRRFYLYGTPIFMMGPCSAHHQWVSA